MNPLVRYDEACRAIAAAKVVDEVKSFHDKAAAMQAYARQAKNRDLEIDAAEIRMRAERRLGELLKAAKGKGQVSRGQPPKSQKNPAKSAEYSRVTLATAGIDHKLSSRSQKLAALPTQKFEGLLRGWRHRVREAKERITTDLLRLDDIQQGRKAYETRKGNGGGSVGAGQTFAVIYADPPWSFTAYRGKDKARAAERRYDAMSLEALSRLPVGAWAAKDCALFLWAVLPELPGALDLIKAWGFEYKTVAFTWIKQNRKSGGLFTGMGYWTRANAEVCLLATRGSPQRIAKNVHQVIMSPVREHSRKPDEAAERIERLLDGPYLELFARGPREGWTALGDDIQAFKEAVE